MAKIGSPTRRKSSLPKLIEKYYADLADLARQNVLFEMGTRPAFHALLAAAGKEHGWTLIAEQEKKVGGKTIRPDGTFKDEMYLVRGYWEAKDTADKLDVEIKKKQTAGYPLNNIIFEDTQTAILYQHGERLLTADMTDPLKLAELITQFFRYVEPEIEEFEQAVEEFKERVPDLAEGLAKKIEQAHRTNTRFKQAFADFFELCKTSLNPNIAQAAVDEMLIQHILTERLIREIFDNPEFVRRNVIAAEVEKVMQAMTSHSFDRNTYLRDLDRFYVAIEHAARTMTDWSDKQYFLNTVYERFFQGYSVKLADTMGIVYTPQEIVDFMCASVAEVLDQEFGKRLWSDDVYIIDPCTGTGNFIVNLIRRIPKAKLEDVYKHRLFANEIMLLPYYIAALNIEHAYWEQEGRYEPFEGLCFVDTLDLAEHAQAQLTFMTAANAARVERQRKSPITLIIGNPPYSANQADENDNNKNRKYPLIDRRIAETYIEASNATLRNKGYDHYWRFLRWASDRLEGRDGIICMITNNGFLRGTASDGFRSHLLKDFDVLYHFDLRGNARTSGARRRAEGGNVFYDKIRAGVGVSILVRHRRQAGKKTPIVRFHAVGDAWRADAKLEYVEKLASMRGVAWQELEPDNRHDWFPPDDADEFGELVPIATKSGKASSGPATGVVFKDYSLGISTNRDPVVYRFESEPLSESIKHFAEHYSRELDRVRRKGIALEKLDDFLDYSQVKWSRNLKRELLLATEFEFDPKSLRTAAYRPFTRQYLYFADTAIDERGQFPRYFPTAKSSDENRVIALTDKGSEKPFMAVMINEIVDLHYVGAACGTQCFPYYVYDEDGTNRRENITDWALKQFREHYHDQKIDKWDIFHYVYGLLHHPGYRQKYADNLKRELPRIPFAPEFHPFAKAGEKLSKLHLDYESLKPWDLDFIETPGMPLSYRVEDKMRLSKDKLRLAVNPSLTLAGIPPQVLEYRLGNRSALEWVIDQYQVSEDKRSGIKSDPNREDDPEYIVRLVGQVIRVSLETVKIVNDLPTEFEPAAK